MTKANFGLLQPTKNSPFSAIGSNGGRSKRRASFFPDAGASGAIGGGTGGLVGAAGAATSDGGGDSVVGSGVPPLCGDGGDVPCRRGFGNPSVMIAWPESTFSLESTSICAWPFLRGCPSDGASAGDPADGPDSLPGGSLPRGESVSAPSPGAGLADGADAGGDSAGSVGAAAGGPSGMTQGVPGIGSPVVPAALLGVEDESPPVSRGGGLIHGEGGSAGASFNAAGRPFASTVGSTVFPGGTLFSPFGSTVFPGKAESRREGESPGTGTSPAAVGIGLESVVASPCGLAQPPA